MRTTAGLVIGFFVAMGLGCAPTGDAGTDPMGSGGGAPMDGTGGSIAMSGGGSTGGMRTGGTGGAMASTGGAPGTGGASAASGGASGTGGAVAMTVPYCQYQPDPQKASSCSTMSAPYRSKDGLPCSTYDPNLPVSVDAGTPAPAVWWDCQTILGQLVGGSYENMPTIVVKSCQECSAQ